MGNGWRNRLMAPVYALVIAFLLVLMLGFALHKPTTRIRFESGSDKLAGIPVVVVIRTSRMDLQTDQLGQVTVATPAGTFSVLRATNRHAAYLYTIPTVWHARGHAQAGRLTPCCPSGTAIGRRWSRG